MKKNLKLSLLMLSVFAFTAPLASCKKNEDDRIAVTWWNNYVAPTSGTDEDNRKNTKYNEYYFAKDVIDQFEKDHPNIRVDMVYKGKYNEIANEIKDGISTGNIPSLASGYADNTAVYANQGVALDVSSFIDSPKFGFGKKGNSNATYFENDSADNYVEDTTTAKADFSSSFLEIEKGMYKGGKLYSMPYSKSSEALYLNKDMMDKVGKGECGTTTAGKGNTNLTYKAPEAAATKIKYVLDTNSDGTVSFLELIDVARKAKADFPSIFNDSGRYKDDSHDGGGTDQEGYKYACPIVYDSAENLFITACEALGVPYLNANGTDAASQVLFNNADAKKVVTQLKAWYDEGLICTTNQLYYTNKSKGYHQYATQLLKNGKAIAIISSTAGARYVADEGFICEIQDNVSYLRSDFGLEGGKTTPVKKVISQGPSISFFKNKDERVERASFEFYKALTNSTNSYKLASKTSYFPIRVSSNNQIVEEYKEAIKKDNGTYAERQKANTGKMFNLNVKYNNEKVNYMTQAFTYSSASRTAVGNLMSSVLKEGVEVDTAFSSAYNTVVK